MKKLILLVAVFLICSGCSLESGSNTSEDTSSKELSKPVSNIPNAESVSSTIEISTDSIDGDKQIDKINGYDSYKDLLVKGLSNSSILFSDNEFTEELILHENLAVDSAYTATLRKGKMSQCVLIGSTLKLETVWFLVVNTENQSLCLYAGTNFGTPPEISFADVDGDNLQEIIIHSDTLALGTNYPFFDNAIIKLENDTLLSLYNSRGYDEAKKHIDTGFIMILQNGYRGIVKNTHTGSETEFDTSSFHIYDEKGNVNDPSNDIVADTHYANSKTQADNFLTFEPKEIDSDGVSEIVVSEAFFLKSEVRWRTGLCYSILKYDAELDRFIVTKSAYLDDSDSDSQPGFQDNWYK